MTFVLVERPGRYPLEIVLLEGDEDIALARALTELDAPVPGPRLNTSKLKAQFDAAGRYRLFVALAGQMALLPLEFWTLAEEEEIPDAWQ